MNTTSTRPIFRGFLLFVEEILSPAPEGALPILSVLEAYHRWCRHRGESSDAESRQGLLLLIERFNLEGHQFQIYSPMEMKHARLLGYEFNPASFEALQAPIGKMYQHFPSPVYAFLDFFRAKCVRKPGASVKLKDLVAAYFCYCEKEGKMPEIMSSHRAAPQLARIGFFTETGGGNYRKIPHVELLP
jgi:hypothetical protein